MGGGTPLLEANQVGGDVQGFDINPTAAWIVRGGNRAPGFGCLQPGSERSE